MAHRFLTSILIELCLLAAVAGCVSTPTSDAGRYDEQELKTEELDVLFATEFPVESEEEALANAARALKDGEIDKAIFFYVRALQFDPENVDLLAHIGDIHMQRNNFVMAKRAYLQARRFDPVHASTLESLGLIYMSEGKVEDAVVELTVAIANDPKRWRAHNALGVYADRNGDFETAQTHYDAALAVRPDAAHVLNNRGYSKFLGGDTHGAALDLYEAANAGGFGRAWGNLGMVYAKQGWYDDAVDSYQHIMSEANAYHNAGRIALENGDLDHASEFLNEAIVRSPTYFPEAEQNLKLLEKMYQSGSMR